MKKQHTFVRHALLLLGATLFLGTAIPQAWSDDRDGFWDHGHRWHHYEYYHDHRGYWDERNGVRVFINI
ncbi:MAG TPA: hypothetical protein VL981_10890 [Candidatus Methylacidiphilales bacterium]|nr:hypothetical protein [Candidatus Methylacidiphilales bacterium]